MVCGVPLEQLTEELEGLTSLWTIDVAMLLHRHHMRVRVCTLVAGVDDAHAQRDFYARLGSFHVDKERVERLHVQCPFPIIEQTFDDVQLRQLLSASRCLIVLVDSNLLVEYIGSFLNYVMTYRGHYIVLLRYEEESNRYVYLNPARRETESHCSPEILTRARCAVGTDQDVIVVE